MRNGRCRMHGGMSTGPRTPEGLERSRHARWKHGAYSRETKAILRKSRRQWRALVRFCVKQLSELARAWKPAVTAHNPHAMTGQLIVFRGRAAVMSGRSRDYGESRAAGVF
jgi:hypothetical protein